MGAPIRPPPMSVLLRLVLPPFSASSVRFAIRTSPTRFCLMPSRTEIRSGSAGWLTGNSASEQAQLLQSSTCKGRARHSVRAAEVVLYNLRRARSDAPYLRPSSSGELFVMTTANKVTIFRIVLIPFFVVEVLYYVKTGNEL